MTIVEAGTAPVRARARRGGRHPARCSLRAPHGVDVRTDTRRRRAFAEDPPAAFARSSSVTESSSPATSCWSPSGMRRRRAPPSPAAPARLRLRRRRRGSAATGRAPPRAPPTAARVLSGSRTQRPTGPSFFWSDQFDLRLQLVGAPQNSATASSFRVVGERFTARYLEAGGRLIAALAVNQPDEIPLRCGVS